VFGSDPNTISLATLRFEQQEGNKKGAAIPARRRRRPPGMEDRETEVVDGDSLLRLFLASVGSAGFSKETARQSWGPWHVEDAWALGRVIK
jgi:hypothetical protein